MTTAAQVQRASPELKLLHKSYLRANVNTSAQLIACIARDRRFTTVTWSFGLVKESLNLYGDSNKFTQSFVHAHSPVQGEQALLCASAFLCRG